MIENTSNEDDGRTYTGQDVLYREKGVSALDVQRAADALLRRGQKPSIAAVREHLGGGSPNNLGPLLEKYWRSLGARLSAGPDALERVPESLARMTEALWLRSLDEARERTKASLIGTAPSQKVLAALESKVSELTAALAESRARSSEMEAQLLGSLRERLEIREQVQQLTKLLKAEQELRMQERESAAADRHELQINRAEVLALARRRLGSRGIRNTGAEPLNVRSKKRAKKPRPSLRNASEGRRPPGPRTRVATKVRR